MPYPHNLEVTEAGLPGSFWQGIPTTDGLGHVQVLEQAQSSRWSLSTDGTPLQGIFPDPTDPPKSLFRSRLPATPSISDLRSKSLYDDSSRKKTLLTKARPADEHLANMVQPLNLTIGLNDGKIAATALIRTASDSDSSSPSVSPVGSDKSARWQRRKNSLGKIVHYPSKMLGKFLTKRGENPPPKENVVLPVPDISHPLRRAETTVRRPKRSSELERPDESTKRWSISSTQAIRAETFSRPTADHLRPDPKKTAADSTLPPLSTNTRHHPQRPRVPLPPPPPILTRSQTQPGTQRPRKTPESNKKLERNLSGRPPIPRSTDPLPPFLFLRQGLASEPHLPRSDSDEIATESTITTIANRIVARELQVYKPHDSWDFLDYYAQSSASSPGRDGLSLH
jgi:hypothetical protein